MSKKTRHAGIKRNDTFRDAMSAVIGENWGVLLETLPSGEDLTDPEAIHKTRVASRRLRAAMDVSADAFPKPWYRHLHKVAKESTGAFGRVRDTDVQIEELQALFVKFTGDEQLAIAWLIGELQTERTQALHDLQVYVDGLAPRKLSKEVADRFPTGKRSKKR